MRGLGATRIVQLLEMRLKKTVLSGSVPGSRFCNHLTFQSGKEYCHIFTKKYVKLAKKIVLHFIIIFLDTINHVHLSCTSRTYNYFQVKTKQQSLQKEMITGKFSDGF